MTQKLFTAAFALLAATQAHAVVLPGWERPIQKAEMKITEAAGVFAAARDADLTMTKRDGSVDATGFVLLLDGQPRVFEVVSAEKAGCGSLRYVARLRTAAPRIFSDEQAIDQLVVEDHTGRACRDYRPYAWEAKVERDALGSLELVGNPEPVYSIQ